MLLVHTQVLSVLTDMLLPNANVLSHAVGPYAYAMLFCMSYEDCMSGDINQSVNQASRY